MKTRTNVRIRALVLVVLSMSCLVWHINRTYYFNPLTFKRDAVTSAAWKEYKNPMQLMVVYQPAVGTMSRYTTENRTEIDYVISQLKAAQYDTTYKSSNEMGQIWVQFRNAGSGADYIDAIIRGNYKVALLSQTYPVTVTSGLKNFIEDKRKSAKEE